MLYNSFGNWAEGVRPCEHHRPQSSSSSSSSSSNNNYASTTSLSTSSSTSNFYYQHSYHTVTGDHLLSGGDWCHDQQSSSSSASSPSSAADTEFSDWFYQQETDSTPATSASGRPFSTSYSPAQLWDLTLTGKSRNSFGNILYVMCEHLKTFPPVTTSVGARQQTSLITRVRARFLSTPRDV